MAVEVEGGQQLTGWKEIAHHLRVCVRTAQAYEKEQALPVHRGAGLKAPVFAIPAELNAWRIACGRGPGAVTTPVPSAEPTLDRRTWLRYGAVCGGAIATGVVLGHGLPRLRLGQHSRPNDFRVEGSNLIILGNDGTELWRHSFPEPLQESAYRNCSPECDGCQFADLDGDGRLETLFRHYPRSGEARLICFDSEGKVLWDFAPSRTVIDNLGHSFAPPFWPNRFAAFGAKRQQHGRVVVSSNHNWSFPNQVAVLDARTGKLLSEYWHRGHLLHMAIADIDGDGELEVLLGGVNDALEYKQATLVIFDPRNISGASKNPKGGVYFQGMDPGTEKREVFFPRTEISRGIEFNQVTVVAVASDRIRVNVVESLDASGPFVVYEFDFQLRPINIALSNKLMDAYREVWSSGRLPRESFSEITERLRSQIVVR